eukprot:gene8874-18373_t
MLQNFVKNHCEGGVCMVYGGSWWFRLAVLHGHLSAIVSIEGATTKNIVFRSAILSSTSPAKMSLVLPNLPGVRKNPVTANPKLFRDYKNATGGSTAEDEMNPNVSFFADMDEFTEASRSIMSYPGNAASYNDTSGRYSLRAQTRDRESKTRSLPFNNLDSVPSFVVDDKRVCRFIATFEEEVPSNLTEPFRTRKVHISFFLEDNTMEIVEPIEPNTGLMQGKILRRHQVVKPSGGDPDPEISIYVISDFTSGAIISIYHRNYSIIDCDNRTRNIMAEIGLEFGDALPLPSNYFDASSSRVSTGQRKSTELFTQSSRAATTETKSFFKDGEIVLRFYGVWDDRESMFGIENHIRIHFYVNNSTMEILQKFLPNDGRDRVPVMLSRSKVKKVVEMPLDQPSLTYFMEEIHTDDDIYHWDDFHIGVEIHVIGVTIKILDADSFTRRFFEEQGCPLTEAITLQKELSKVFSRTIPPHNGFGSDEDSKQTCTGKLISSPIRKDITKIKKFAGQIIRFRARIISNKNSDKNRTFVFQMRLEDDTVQIREPPVRNSGFWGGMFLSGEKLKKADGSFITPKDIYVGANITAHATIFILEESDEFTLKYMESHCDIWLQSSIDIIREKLLPQEAALTRIVLTAPGSPSREVPYSEVEKIICGRTGISLTKQEIITLQRALDSQKRGSIRLSKIISLLKFEEM